MQKIQLAKVWYCKYLKWASCESPQLWITPLPQFFNDSNLRILAQVISHTLSAATPLENCSTVTRQGRVWWMRPPSGGASANICESISWGRTSLRTLRSACTSSVSDFVGEAASFASYHLHFHWATFTVDLPKNYTGGGFLDSYNQTLRQELSGLGWKTQELSHASLKIQNTMQIKSHGSSVTRL